MDIYNFIKSRRTIRKFKQDRLTKEQLAKYIDTARVAPSAANIQPLKYVAVVSREMTEKMFPLVKWAGYLAPMYNPKEGERPTAYVVVCADTTIRKSGYDMDIGAAVENMMLCALADNVGACWMASIDRDGIRKLLDIPETLEISCVVALGYLAETPKEAEVENGDIKYYLGESDTLYVPKRAMSEIVIKTV
ncbi:MAG: nitroreductase family protein [Clostridia bacterium]|nr:nitroreductase family protein [Clostridia bacterium]